MLATFLVTNSDDAIVNTPESVGTLRQAIFDANQFPDADIINFDLPPNEDTILLSQGELDIIRPVMIDTTDINGDLQDITIDASNSVGMDDGIDNGNGSRIFDIDINSTSSQVLVGIKGLTFTGGDSGGDGGAIDFVDDANPFLAQGGTLLIEDSLFFDNNASSRGGAVNADSGILVVQNTTFIANKVISTFGGSGGGVSLDRNVSSATISDSQFIDNVTSDGINAGNGGGLWMSLHATESITQEVTIERSEFRNNQALGLQENAGGGGIYADLHGGNNIPKLTVRDTTVSDNNFAASDGGGIWVCTKFGAEFELHSSTISGNTAGSIQTDYYQNEFVYGGDGGGLWMGVIPHDSSSQLLATIENVTISGNTALSRGGGVWIGKPETLLNNPAASLVTNINHTTITDNNSPEGGGLFSELNVLLDIFDTTLTNTIVSGNVVSATNSTPNNVSGDIEDDSSFNFLGSGGNAILPVVTSPLFNIHDDDPELLPLDDNGGPTQTHQPMTTSPVVDAGDHSIVFDPMEYDQRGVGFPRVVNIVGINDGSSDIGPIDIGAYELQTGTGPQVMSVALIGNNLLDAQNGVYDYAVTDPNPAYGPRVGSGNQIRSVPLGGINQVSITFSEDVIVAEGDLSVIGLINPLANPDPLMPGGFSYSNNTATWDFDPAYFDDGHFDFFLLRLDDTVRASGGSQLALDGEWVNPATVSSTEMSISEFPSGNDSPGGEFQFVFTVLPGDLENGIVLRDNDVDILDFGILADFFGELEDMGYINGDFNGDGDVDIIDFGFLADTLGIDMTDLAFASDIDGDFDVDSDDLLALLNDPDAFDLAFELFNFGVDFDVA